LAAALPPPAAPNRHQQEASGEFSLRFATRRPDNPPSRGPGRGFSVGLARDLRLRGLGDEAGTSARRHGRRA
ncbi:MAG: hypothetical protein QME94_08910, partial [Anaerolineae bacterium]|nr:hypothetical protein [Anaerolineae bacterium]